MLKAVHPVLPARDVSRAIAYYKRLGFTLKFQDTPDAPRFAAVERDNVQLHLQWHDERDFGKVERLSLRFVVPDVDALFEEFAAQDVFHERTRLQDTSWGTREFAFYDGDGNGLFFYRNL